MKKLTKVIQPENFPKLPTIDEIQKRLALIFPESFPDRGILISPMAAKVIFVFFYGGFIEDVNRYLRPSYIYLFTDEQSQQTSTEDRIGWLSTVNKPGYRLAGQRWYADNSREQIRDDFMRNQLLRLGIMHKLPGIPTTSSKPTYYLDKDFAKLFMLPGNKLIRAINEWRETHLSNATLQRMALKAQGIQAKGGDVFIEMPDGARIRISAGPSANIVKGLIEDYSIRHMKNPAVLWLSASDKKSYPQFVGLAKSVGLTFHPSKELPDLILAEMNEPVGFVFCEVVATDGAVTEARKEALLGLINASNIPESAVKFLTAFEDREATPFRKNFSQLAIDSLVWFRTEPDLLVILSKANRAKHDPNK